MLSSKILAASPVLLYPVKFTMELWIEDEDMTGIVEYFLQTGASILEVFLSCKAQSLGRKKLAEITNGCGQRDI